MISSFWPFSSFIAVGLVASLNLFAASNEPSFRASDALLGTEGDDILISTRDSEVIEGGRGADRYEFDRFFGFDTIVEPLYFRDPQTGGRIENRDRNEVYFTYDRAADVDFDQDGADLIIEASRQDTVRIKDFFGYSRSLERGPLPKSFINPISVFTFADGQRLEGKALRQRLEDEFELLLPTGIDFTAIDFPDARDNPPAQLPRCDRQGLDILQASYVCHEGYLRGDYPRTISVRLLGLDSSHDLRVTAEKSGDVLAAYGDDTIDLDPRDSFVITISHPDTWRRVSVKVSFALYPVAP
jgi:hypothetical protein